jgi:hypothetical protein
MRRIVLPALIVKAPHGAAMVQGVPLLDGKKVYKTVEVRGARCRTSYRGAVAIFASNTYDLSVEQHYTWFGAWCSQSDKRRAVKLTTEQDHHFRSWSQFSHAWRYSLIGFVRLTDCIDGRTLTFDGPKMRALHVGATDFRSDWSDPEKPNIYLKVEPLYERLAADGPKFNAACYGCIVQTPPHNATACHVNWQTVQLDEKHVPLNVQQEIRPWPFPQK